MSYDLEERAGCLTAGTLLIIALAAGLAVLVQVQAEREVFRDVQRDSKEGCLP